MARKSASKSRKPPPTLEIAKRDARRLAARGNELGSRVVVGKLFEPAPRGGEQWTWRVLLLDHAEPIQLADGRRFEPVTAYAPKAIGQLYAPNPIMRGLVNSELGKIYDSLIKVNRHPLGVLLAFLRALADLEWAWHWTTSGPHYYEDHRLYERLYDATYKEIDTLAERVAVEEAPLMLDPRLQAEMVSRILRDGYLFDYFGGIPPADKMPASLFYAETDFVELIGRTLDSKRWSPGIQTLLGDMASEHEQHVYLLHGRIS